MYYEYLKKKSYITSNGGGQMIVWPPDFPVWGGPCPPPGYATGLSYVFNLFLFIGFKAFQSEPLSLHSKNLLTKFQQNFLLRYPN